MHDGFKRKYCNVSEEQLAKNEKLWQAMVKNRKQQQLELKATQFKRARRDDINWLHCSEGMARLFGLETRGE